MLLLLLLNPLIRNSVLQLLVSNEKHYLRNSMEEQTVFNSLATATSIHRSSITSATVPALSPTGVEGCTFFLLLVRIHLP
ncbi:hypothetical protein MKX03_001234 [Papaver bracteatum]|nr:hypothetical protein MKX03_001234 [Papaver bracteatum]